MPLTPILAHGANGLIVLFLIPVALCALGCLVVGFRKALRSKSTKDWLIGASLCVGGLAMIIFSPYICSLLFMLLSLFL